MITPIDADLAAVKRLLGDNYNEPPTLSVGVLRKYQIMGSGAAVWNVELRTDTKHGGQYLYCPCPGWKFNQATPKRCKHTDTAENLGRRGFQAFQP